MNVFQLRDNLISDYRSFVQSFIRIRDAKIKKVVDDAISEKVFWPDPLIQMNPNFEMGESIDELVDSEVLHRECKRIFRVRHEGQPSAPMRLYRHQSEAIKVAQGGDNYVLTTGTGSGKSLTYIVPIVDHVLRRGTGKGIQAIIVYPMNALANSQMKALEGYLRLNSSDKGLVTFGRYTGQDDEEQRKYLQDHKPDILLTNYVMLEYILTRPGDEHILKAAENLRFLVLDELHTYRGRQGADVALLVRRLRNRLKSQHLQIVGTSATLAGGSYEERSIKIAKVATQLFGEKVKPENVIGETLQRITPERDPGDAAFMGEVADRVPTVASVPASSYAQFTADPFSSWLETTFGVKRDISGRLVRATPISIEGEFGAAAELSKRTQIDVEKCANAIQAGLMSGSEMQASPQAKAAAFAFRLHQFISRGDTVYATLESENARYITLNAQRYKPGDDSRILLPLAFCRRCGQEYYSVLRRMTLDGSTEEFVPRDTGDQSDDMGKPGFLYLDTTGRWPEDEQEVLNRLPVDWVDRSRTIPRRNDKGKKYGPKPVQVSISGVKVEGEANTPVCQFIPTPFLFCLNCSVTYEPRQRSDFAKLSTLSSEGRSTATTILSMSAVRHLREGVKEAAKLLSFTDNRQDASLQAGHFNDFIEVGLIRAAIYRAAKDTPGGLDYKNVAERVFDALDLPFENYSSNPEAVGPARNAANQALRDVLGYRVFRDLKRGWRVTAPNLEQCGLIEVQYPALSELCAKEDEWSGTDKLLVGASHAKRYNIAKRLLDILRRGLAIKINYLDPDEQEKIRQQGQQELTGMWALDSADGVEERLEYAATAYPDTRDRGDTRANLYISEYSAFGQYLRNNLEAFGDLPVSEKPNRAQCREIIKSLLEVLAKGNLVEAVGTKQERTRWRRGQPPTNGQQPAHDQQPINDQQPTAQQEVNGYQLKASAIRWLGIDQPLPDSLELDQPSPDSLEADDERGDETQPLLEANQFFYDFYRDVAESLSSKAKAGEYTKLEAREHTAQVPDDVREEREDSFRAGRLPILYCSPTMELGIDIADLSVVNMRNVPPTPANYAQRSGRAGRSGQPALVFAYCSTGSSHDQYFFKHQQAMVSGEVAVPRLDLANEDLIRSHIQAIWLAETNCNLGRSLKEILDLSNIDTLPLLTGIRTYINDQDAAKATQMRAEQVLETLGTELENAEWYHDKWLDVVLNNITQTFDATCNRWRDLYRAAHNQRRVQDEIIMDYTRDSKDKQLAKSLRAEAEAQIELLTDEDHARFSDFYSYRYFASEGFLPGYSFPRLPLSAFIPPPQRRRASQRIRGQQDKKGKSEGTYLSRPRFLAVSEFGPRAIVYHEGSRYVIERVILPVGKGNQAGQRDLMTTAATICPHCGYYHPANQQKDQSALCELCKAEFPSATATSGSKPHRLNTLFRLQNVATRRRDRINSDEEERMRVGYDIITALRFAERHGQPYRRTAEVQTSDGTVMNLSYGSNATIYRVNLGWRVREDKHKYGFMLDTERGYWANNKRLEEEKNDEKGRHYEPVIPYVEDRRNSLTIEVLPIIDKPAEDDKRSQADWRERRRQVASLMAALKKAIQLIYQLEDSELAVDLLPNADYPRLILIYEAAEGGAGVLRQLLEDKEGKAIDDVARIALELCHFNPQTGADEHMAKHAREECTKACYDCLLSYQNQIYHELLDRHAIKDILWEMAHSQTLDTSPALAAPPEGEPMAEPDAQDITARWKRFMKQHDLRMPERENAVVGKYHPDFVYDSGRRVAIYIDGSPNEFPERHSRDLDAEDYLPDYGYTVVIRFAAEVEWEKMIRRFPRVFGEFK